MHKQHKPMPLFDFYAMVEPKNPSDQATVLREVLSELDCINAKLDFILGEDELDAGFPTSPHP